MFELDLLELVKFLRPALEQRGKPQQKLSVGVCEWSKQMSWVSGVWGMGWG